MIKGKSIYKLVPVIIALGILSLVMLGCNPDSKDPPKVDHPTGEHPKAEDIEVKDKKAEHPHAEHPK